MRYRNHHSSPLPPDDLGDVRPSLVISMNYSPEGGMRKYKEWKPTLCISASYPATGNDSPSIYATYEACREARRNAAKYAGGLSWKAVSVREY